MQRGLVKACIRALMWEGRHFLSWYTAGGPVDNFTGLSISDIDIYLKIRAAGLRRRSLKDVAERLRSMLGFLHRTGRIGVDLAPRIIGPMLYVYESIPSALSAGQISAVLKSTRKDRSPVGCRITRSCCCYRPTDCVTQKFFADRMGNELPAPGRCAGALSTEAISTVTTHEVRRFEPAAHPRAFARRSWTSSNTEGASAKDHIAMIASVIAHPADEAGAKGTIGLP